MLLSALVDLELSAARLDEAQLLCSAKTDGVQASWPVPYTVRYSAPMEFVSRVAMRSSTKANQNRISIFNIPRSGNGKG